MALKVVRIINQPVTSNCFLLYDREVNNDCLVVDPGSEYPDELEQLLRDLNLYPKYILLTHEHFDHIWGCNYLVEKYHSKIICSVLFCVLRLYRMLKEIILCFITKKLFRFLRQIFVSKILGLIGIGMGGILPFLLRKAIQMPGFVLK